MSITMRPTDAAEVVSTTAEGFRPAAAVNGLEIVVQLHGNAGASSGARSVPGSVPGSGAVATAAPAVARVAADPDRLAQLLANLLENAMTFARHTVTVTVWDDASAGVCRIAVDDDGPGIPRDDLHRVFERFYRADRGPNRRVGSGLGLAIVAELAAAMGGTVQAESPLGVDGGTRFVVTLRGWQAQADGAGQRGT
jgi:signal transduction histidine kinase